MSKKKYQEIYKEDVEITLPNVHNGVTNLGDLWDCQTSTALTNSLFIKDLDEHHLRVSPKGSMQAFITRIKTSEDKLKSLHLNGEISVELLSGTIKLSGSANFDYSSKKENLYEELIYHCYYQTFSVDFLESATKELLNEFVFKQISEKKIKATHVVKRVIIGAQVDCSIKISNSDHTKKTDINGDFLGKLTFGSVSASLKSDLKWLDSNDAKKYNSIISIESKPPLEQPRNIEEMLKIIDNIDNKIKQHSYFKQVKNCEVYGVPIQYILTPISQILNIKIERLYICLIQEVMTKFETMLKIMKDFETEGCIKRFILREDPKVNILVFDENSEISKEIKEYENITTKISSKYLKETIDVFKNYKIKKKTEEDLLKLINQFDEEFNYSARKDKINQFTNKCKHELIKVNYSEAPQSISFFTNKITLDEWFRTESYAKILLKAGEICQDEVFSELYSISDELSKIGFKIGIAFPSVYAEFSLSIKIGCNSDSYANDEILFVIKLMKTLLSRSSRNEQLFFKICMELREIPFSLTKETLSGITENIKELSFMHKIQIAKTNIETKNLLIQKDDKYKFFLTLDAIYTATEAIEYFIRLFNWFESNSKIDWIVGSLGINRYNSAPLLFCIKNADIIAVCTDYLDIMILENIFKNSNEKDFTLLSCNNLNHTFHAERVNYTNELIYGKKTNLEFSNFSGFDEKSENESLKEAMVITRAVLNKNFNELFASIASLASKYISGLCHTLSKFGIVINENSSCTINNNLPWDTISEKLLEHLKRKNHFIAEVYYVHDSIEADLKVNDFKKCDSLIEGIQSNNQIEKKLNDEIKFWKSSKNPEKYKHILKLLEDFLSDWCTSNELFHLFQLIKLSEKYHKGPLSEIEFAKVIKSYIERIKINGTESSKLKKDLKGLCEEHKYFGCLSELTKNSYGNLLNKLNKTLNKFSRIQDKPAFLNLLKIILFNKNELQPLDMSYLWNNKRILHLVECNITPNVLMNIANYYIIDDELRVFLPEELFDKLSEYIPSIREISIPDKFKDLVELKDVMKQISRLKLYDLPSKFHSAISLTLRENETIRTMLLNSQAIKKWDVKKMYFIEPWNLTDLDEIIQQLSLEKDQMPIIEINDNQFKFSMFDLFNNETENGQSLQAHIIRIHKDYEKIMGNEKEKYLYSDFIKVTELLKHPQIKSNDLNKWLFNSLDYALQKVKMWGCNSLLPQNIVKNILDAVNTNDQISNSKRPNFSKKESSQNTISSPINSNYLPVSRLDLITMIVNVSDLVTNYTILGILSKFPIAIPLIIKGIESHKQKPFLCLLPILNGPTIRWEEEGSSIVQHDLFDNDSKFYLTVAIRIGKNSKGKSTILNQMFSTNNVFSSCGEPGSKYGKPYTLDGSVEFVLLTKETCNDLLWSCIQNNYKSKDSNRILLLANLHGDALEYPDHLNLLKTIACSFIVFIMPDIEDKSEEKWNKLEKIIGNNAELEFIRIDPGQDIKEEESKKFNTNQLTNDSELEKIRNIISNLTKSKDHKTIKELKCNNDQTINLLQNIETPESLELIKFIKTHSCKGIRQIMKLQGEKIISHKTYELWENDEKLNKLIFLFVKILSLPKNQRKIAFLHIEHEIGKIFYKESLKIRKITEKLTKDLQKSLHLNQDKEETEYEKRLRSYLNENCKNLNDIRLSTEHFFRELTKIYQLMSLTKSEPVKMLHLGRSYAELFLEGQSIEILNGDLGELPSDWFNCICNHINQKYPNLRVYVISIIGLQSSGKSTLFNALFGCNFPVSIGRCTRGIHLRLAFLEKNLAASLQIDAFIIIDTEGLDPPEQMNDPENERKDRLLATFVMGISNLIIINVLGESMNNLTGILQIAIITLSRLDGVEMNSDILLVQHMNEKNVAMLRQAIDQFLKALKNAVDLADKRFIEAGIKNSNKLESLLRRAEIGNMYKPFSPFKSGSSVFCSPSEEYHQDIINLYETILDLAKENGILFSNWQKSMSTYWDAVSKDDFATRFKNIKEFGEFLEREQLITQVRESFEFAFCHHINIDIKPWLKDQLSDCYSNPSSKESILNEIPIKLKYIVRDCKLNGSICQKCQDANHKVGMLKKLVAAKIYECETLNRINFVLRSVLQSYEAKIKEQFIAWCIHKFSSSHFLDLIDENIQKFIEAGKKLGPSECIEQVDDIWNILLNDAASFSIVRNVEELVDNEILQHYKQENVINEYKKITIDSQFSKKLSRREDLQNIKEECEMYVNNIFQGNESFQTGMIPQLQKQISNLLNRYDKFSKLNADFKFNVHKYGLRILLNRAKEKQIKWNKKNKPIEILKTEEPFYKDLILTKLKFGYKMDREGIIIGNLLLKSIVKNALEKAHSEGFEKVLSYKPLSNARNIRLMYILELVKRDNRYEILEHFKSPKESIELWYNLKVEQLFGETANKVFSKWFEEEYRIMYTKVNDKSNPINELLKDIERYTKNIRSAYSESLISIFRNDELCHNDDGEIIRNTILKTINYKKGENSSYRVGPLAYCNSGDPIGDNDIIKEKSDIIMRRLGCTHCCPLCTAICWGASEHPNSVKHFTSHQPAGLTGKKSRRNNNLAHELCSFYVDNQNLISQHKDGWKFDNKDVKKEFDDVLRWLFAKYNRDIAYMYDVLPVPENIINELGWLNININRTISTIESEVNYLEHLQ